MDSPLPGIESACLFVGDLFLAPPNAAAVPRLSGETRALEPAGLADIEADFASLFVGPDRTLAPPYESVYLGGEGLLFDAGTLDVRAHYARYGIEVARKGRVPDDHLSCELHFAAHLAGLVEARLEAGDEDGAIDVLADLKEFLEAHLGRWAPKFAARVEAGAKTGFYRDAAGLLRDTVENLAASVSRALGSRPRG